jgi:hypothetical protein
MEDAKAWLSSQAVDFFNTDIQELYVRFEVFTAVTIKNAVFWDVAPCRSCALNRRFGGTSVQSTRSTRCNIPEDGILHTRTYSPIRRVPEFRR